MDTLDQLELDLSQCLSRIAANADTLQQEYLAGTATDAHVTLRKTILEKQLADAAMVMRDLEQTLDRANEENEIDDREYVQRFHQLSTFDRKYRALQIRDSVLAAGIATQHDSPPETPPPTPEQKPKQLHMSDLHAMKSPPPPVPSPEPVRLSDRDALFEGTSAASRSTSRTRAAAPSAKKPGDATIRADERAAAMFRARALLSDAMERMSSVATLINHDADTLTHTLQQHEMYGQEVQSAKSNVDKYKMKERRDASYMYAAFAFLVFTALYITLRRLLWLVGIRLP